MALIWPCHRVIGANGALVGFGGGLPLKRALLDFESVIAGRPRDLFASA
ncbi:MAG TPA: MGMT family protein [Rhizomicrobium sp.]|nr:MGMT family protein [Rhizomicrobium sp.]